MQIRATIVVILSVAWASGCTRTPPKPPAPDPTRVQLASAAESVRASLGQLAEAEQFNKLKRAPGTSSVAPVIPGLSQSISLPWQGPLEAVVMKIATMGGYEIDYAGHPPALPILVSIGPEPATLAALLRNVGLQAGDRADIVVDPQRRRIGVVYADTGL